MKIKLLLAFIIILAINKGQCDTLILNGKVMSINSVTPFDNYPGIKKLRETLKDYRTQCMDDGCSFSSKWKVVNKELVLIDIHSCECNSDKRTANLADIFPGKLHNGVLKAAWFTGTLWLIGNADKPVTYVGISPLMRPIYSAETCLTIVKGVITGIKSYTYPPSSKSDFPGDPVTLANFSLKHIDWKQVHLNTDQIDTVAFNVIIDTEGHPTKILGELFKGKPENADAVLNSLRQLKWEVYYTHGQILQYGHYVSLILREKDHSVSPAYY